MLFDIAIVGAGMAGLTCAQQLHQAGYSVVVLEKSRGLGGRMATRRLQGTWADHGTCYLNPKHDPFQQLVAFLVDQSVLQIWTETIHQLDDTGKLQADGDRSFRYASPSGITAVGKFLATDLTIQFEQRVVGIELTTGIWQLTCVPSADAGNPSIVSAKAVVLAIPAPQILPLLDSVEDASLLDRLRSVSFAPCISAIAVYAAERQADATALGWQGITWLHDPDIAWIGLDSSKQSQPSQPVIIVQSNAKFATSHLETADLRPIGQQLLDRVADQLANWLSQPIALQVHRWRYAFPVLPLPVPYLAAQTSLPLICTGDWCGGNRVESAFWAGLATAQHLNEQLQQRSLPAHFWQTIATKNP